MAQIKGTIQEIAEKAQRLLRSLVPNSHCTAHEWDDRIDCTARLPNGTEIVGEMISISEVTEERILETATRLRQKQLGEDVQLVDELPQPIHILSS